MKKFLVSLALVTILLSCCVLPTFAAEPSSLSVHLRIEGKDQNLFYGEITTNNSANYNLISILRLANTQSDSLNIEGLEYGYITAVNGVGTGQTAAGKDTYVVMINNSRIAFEDISAYELKSGDSIVVCYVDNYGEDIIVPIINTEKLDSGYIKFSYEKSSADGKTVTTMPLIGAEVTWYCDNAPFSYITDGQGGIYIDKNALSSGDHRLSVELKSENGVPLLLRPSPDFTINVAVGIGDSFAVYFYAVTAFLSLLTAIMLATSIKRRKRV